MAVAAVVESSVGVVIGLRLIVFIVLEMVVALAVLPAPAAPA